MSMQPEVEYGNWYVVETTQGTCVIDVSLVGDNPSADELLPYLDVHSTSNIYEWELQSGYCARLSMPGYLDCTDWIGPYSTEQEALSMLDLFYNGE